ncbi:hypothetical protein ACIBEA_35570 [Streptomyces sp. NPDC051555]|uniref:hypothetical protein n=1 Tax=Streptomyces sp. NPDC051555 TaxID=3365657 RepID=UPI00378FF18C
MAQLLNDPVVRSAAVAGFATYLLAGMISQRVARKTVRREVFDGVEMAPRLGFRASLRRASQVSSPSELRAFTDEQLLDAKQWKMEHLSRTAFTTSVRLGFSMAQGSINLGLAVACCVMALSDPFVSVGDWFPVIIHDQGRLLDGLKEQVSSGSLILRITTTLVAVTALIRYCTQIRAALKNEGSAASLWKGMRQLNLTNAQGGVFLSALTIMWLLQGRGIDGLWMAVLSYVFAFFIDDWTIVSEYSVKLDVPALPLHKWRLRLAYVCLLAPSLVLAWDEFGWWGMAVMAWFVATLASVSLAHRRANENVIWPERAIPQQAGEEVQVDGNLRSEDGAVQT